MPRAGGSAGCAASSGLRAASKKKLLYEQMGTLTKIELMTLATPEENARGHFAPIATSELALATPPDHGCGSLA